MGKKKLEAEEGEKKGGKKVGPKVGSVRLIKPTPPPGSSDGFYATGDFQNDADEDAGNEAEQSVDDDDDDDVLKIEESRFKDMLK